MTRDEERSAASHNSGLATSPNAPTSSDILTRNWLAPALRSAEIIRADTGKWTASLNRDIDTHGQVSCPAYGRSRSALPDRSATPERVTQTRTQVVFHVCPAEESRWVSRERASADAAQHRLALREPAGTADLRVRKRHSRHVAAA